MQRVLYILYTIAALLTVGCRGGEEVLPTGDTISFRTVNSRAATIIGSADEEQFRAEPFAVYGDWIYDDAGNRVELFRDVYVRYTDDSSAPTGWIYDDVQRWQPGGEYDFRAYWPASSTVMGTATAQILALEYNMLTQNFDMMVAYNHCTTGNNGSPVDLSFHHTLSAVAVKFVSTGSQCEYKVKNLFFTSLNYIGALAYDSTSSTPDLTSAWIYNAGSRSYTDTTNILLSERLREWSSSEGRVVPESADDYPEEYDLFLPQSLRVTAGVAQPSITFTVDVTWDTTDTLTITVPLPDTDSSGNEMVWQAGKKYLYVVNIQPDNFSVEVTTSDWDSVDATADDIVF